MAPPHSSPPLLKTSGPQTGVLDQQRRHTQKLMQILGPLRPAGSETLDCGWPPGGRRSPGDSRDTQV